MRLCRCTSQLLFGDAMHTDHPNSSCWFSDSSNKNVTTLSTTRSQTDWAEPQFVFLITIFWRDLIIHWRHDNPHHHLQQWEDGAQVGRHLSKKVEYSEHSRGNKVEWVSSKAKRNLWKWKKEITFKDGFSFILTAFRLISLTETITVMHTYRKQKNDVRCTEQHMEDTKKMPTNTHILHAVCEGRSYISHCLKRLSKFPSWSSWSPELKITVQCKLMHIHWLAPKWGGPKNKPVM